VPRKVRDDAEQRREVLVQHGEQPVNEARSHQHDPEIHPDPLRLEGRGACEAQQLAERLDAHLAVEQRALERVPGVGARQQPDGVDDQEAPVRSV
jgi:hypothetical protein